MSINKKIIQYGSQLFVCGGGAWVGVVAGRGGGGGGVAWQLLGGGLYDVPI